MNKLKKILIYDGTCTLCTGAKNAVEKRDAHQQFETVDAHSERGKNLRAQYNLDTEKSAYVIENDTVREKSDMAFSVLESLGWFERLIARVARLVPKRAADKVYGFVARHRNILTRK